MDWTRLLALCGGKERPEAAPVPARAQVPIAVARDEAFCFTYQETLDALREAGGELLFFSPLTDAGLPREACGLYLPGGYPELYARRLSENEAMRRAVQAAVERGMPTVAECGGFLYLGKTLQGGDGEIYPMAGVLPGDAVRKERLVRFGYAELTGRPGQPAVSVGRERSDPRVPLLGFQRQRGRSDGKKAPDRPQLELRLYGRTPVRRLPPPVFRRPAAVGTAVCASGDSV